VEANRTARSGRSPSSPKRARGIAERAEPAPPEVLGTRERIPQHAASGPRRSRSREVAARRSPSMSARKVTELGRGRRGSALPPKGVTSTLCSPESTVTVPWWIPVGMTLGKQPDHLLRQGVGGHVEVLCRHSTKNVRTAPPASHACLDAPPQRATARHHIGGNGLGSGCTPVSITLGQACAVRSVEVRVTMGAA